MQGLFLSLVRHHYVVVTQAVPFWYLVQLLSANYLLLPCSMTHVLWSLLCLASLPVHQHSLRPIQPIATPDRFSAHIYDSEPGTARHLATSSHSTIRLINAPRQGAPGSLASLPSGSLALQISVALTVFTANSCSWSLIWPSNEASTVSTVWIAHPARQYLNLLLNVLTLWTCVHEYGEHAQKNISCMSMSTMLGNGIQLT